MTKQPRKPARPASKPSRPPHILLNVALDVDELQARLREAEDTLDAIRLGAVDALVVRERDTQQIYTLKSADHTYRVLIESMNQAALTIAEDGTILYSNTQLSTMIGAPLEQIIGSLLQSWFRADDQAELSELISPKPDEAEPPAAADVRSVGAAAAHHPPRELECYLPGDAGVAVVVSATRLPEVEANAYMGIIITDITERKRAERAKDEFISLASHQLRTPATGVKQYLGMLLEGYAGELVDDQRIFIKTAYTSNEKQLGIINSILRTAQIDSGMYKLKKSPHNLLALVDSVLVDFQPVLQMREQLLVCEIADDLEIDIDRAEMCVALSNLVENASKYSPNGKTITITAVQSAKATIIRVTDEGVGIDPADQAKVFEKFTRVDNAMSDTVNGSGLGLYWVQRIIIMHGGTVAIESELDKGTTFTVRLPR